MAETTAGIAAGAVEGATLEGLGYKQELKRALSFGDLVVAGLVMISPTAPFAVYGFVYDRSHGMVPLVYLIGLGAMLFTALSYMTMSRAFPVAGSVYAYAARGIGASAGFIAGWAILLDYLLIPSLCYVFAAIAIHAVAPAIPPRALVVGFLIVVTATNLIGVQAASWFNHAMMWMQLALLVIFAWLAARGLSQGVAGAHLSIAPFFQPKVMSPALLFGALSIAALSFLGFDAISTMSEEARGGSRAVGRATIVTLCLSAALFIVQTWLACLFVLGRPAFGHPADDSAFIDIAGLVGGTWFRTACSVLGIAIGSVACTMVAQVACARLIFGMARDRKLPRWFAHVNEKRQTPERATLLIAGLTLVIGWVMVDKPGVLASLVNFGALTGFLMLHLAVLWRFGLKPGRKIFLHIVTPVIGFAVVAYVLINTDDNAKIPAALSWLAIGAVVLVILKLQKKPLDALPEA